MRGSSIFSGGGGRWSKPDGLKTVWTTFCFFIFSLQLILQFTEGVHWFYYGENYTFPMIQRRSNIFQGGGVNFFQGGGEGLQMLISIETHITCDSPGGVQTPSPPPLFGTAHVWRYQSFFKVFIFNSLHAG